MLKAIIARCVLLGSFLLLPHTNASAIDVYLKDLAGKPIPNAVLAIKKSQFSSSAPAAPAALGSLESPQIMDQVDFLFVPRVLVLNKNDWVSFPNSDNVRHHVYSFSEPMPFEIKMFKGSNSSPVQFPEEGIVVLGCNIHDSMIGYIYVQENEYAFISDKNGKISVDLPETQNETFVTATIWHPQLSVSESERIETALVINSEVQTFTLKITLLDALEDNEDDASDRFRNKFRRNH